MALLIEVIGARTVIRANPHKVPACFADCK